MYQEFASSISSLRNQEKDIICNDCGGISATKVQQLLSTLEGTTQLFNTTSVLNKKKKSKNNRSSLVNKKKNSSRNNTQKKSVQRKKKKIIRQRISNLPKQRKLSIKKIRSSRK